MYYTWLNEFDLAGQNKAWLKSACRERGLSVSGNAATLRERLLEFAEGSCAMDEVVEILLKHQPMTHAIYETPFLCSCEEWQAPKAMWRDYGACERAFALHQAEMLKPVLKAVWDEGFIAGQAYGYAYAQDTYEPSDDEPTPNPYEGA